jgi:hypothetical protein
VHGSLPNVSDNIRATLYLGFIPKQSALRLHKEDEIVQRQMRVPFLTALRAEMDPESSREVAYAYMPLLGKPVANAEVLDLKKYPLLQI